MTSDLPLYPIKLGEPFRGEWFPLHMDRLLGSRFIAITSPAALGVAVTAWCASVRQDPVGTLPLDDVELARLVGFGPGPGVDRWRAVRPAALYGFEQVTVLDADDMPCGVRLGHKVLAHVLLEAMDLMDARRRRKRDNSERARRSQLRATMRKAEIPERFISDDDFIQSVIEHLDARGLTRTRAHVMEAYLAVRDGFEETRRTIVQLTKRI